MPFAPTEDWLAAVRQRVVELPLARKQRFMRDYQLPAGDAEAFVRDAPLGGYFEGLARQAGNPKALANWLINNLRAKLAESQTTLEGLKLSPAQILELIALVDSGDISTSIAQDVFAEMFTSGQSPKAIVEHRGLAQVSDTALIEKLCDEVLAANPRTVADYKAGKAAALNFLKGQAMKLSKGKANPSLVGELLLAKLGCQN